MINNKVLFVIILFLTALLSIQSYSQKRQFQVKQVAGNEITINAGARDGVKAGFTGYTSKEAQLGGKIIQVTTSRFKVITVEETSCRARLETKSPTDPVETGQSAVFDQELTPPIRQIRLTIISNPSGAAVYLEGRQRGETPLDLALSPGTYHIRLTKAGYDEINDRLIVTPDQPLTKSYPLNPSASKNYTLFVDTIPTGAKVIINGTERGQTPLKIDIQEANILMRIEKENYEPVEERVLLTALYTEKNVWLKQEKLFIKISSIPSGAKTYINDQDMDNLPADQQFDKGKYKIRIEKEGYQTVEEEIELSSNFEKTYQLEEIGFGNLIPPQPRPNEAVISQRIKKIGFGPTLGLSLTTQYEEGAQNSFKMGFALGGLMTYKLSDEFSLIGQFLFIQKGYKYSPPNYHNIYEYNLTLNYLELPILARYSFGSDNFRFFLFTGPALAFKIKGNFNWRHDGEYVEGTEVSSKGMDFGLKFGGGFGYSLGSSWLTCELGITLGLLHTLDYANNTNTAILFMLSYLFGRF